MIGKTTMKKIILENLESFGFGPANIVHVNDYVVGLSISHPHGSEVWQFRPTGLHNATGAEIWREVGYDDKMAVTPPTMNPAPIVVHALDPGELAIKRNVALVDALRELWKRQDPDEWNEQFADEVRKLCE